MEEELREKVTAMCKARGFLCHHSHDSRRDADSAPGWPDCVIVGPGGVLFRELKSETGRLEVPQRRAGSLITQAGGNWAVWRPEHLDSGLIALQLAEIGRPR